MQYLQCYHSPVRCWGSSVDVELLWLLAGSALEEGCDSMQISALSPDMALTSCSGCSLFLVKFRLLIGGTLICLSVCWTLSLCWLQTVCVHTASAQHTHCSGNYWWCCWAGGVVEGKGHQLSLMETQQSARPWGINLIIDPKSGSQWYRGNEFWGKVLLPKKPQRWILTCSLWGFFSHFPLGSCWSEVGSWAGPWAAQHSLPARCHCYLQSLSKIKNAYSTCCPSANTPLVL